MATAHQSVSPRPRVAPAYPSRSWRTWPFLHAQTAVLLRLALFFQPGIVITNVPYHVDLDRPAPEREPRGAA